MRSPDPHILLPQHFGHSPARAALLGWLLYIGLIAICVMLSPNGPLHIASNVMLIGFGLVGLWRWLWNIVHVVRAMIYRRVVFPKIRQQADGAAKPAKLYFVVTSYRIKQELNAAVFGRLFDEVARFGVPACIVACVTDAADEKTIVARLAARALPADSQLRVIMQRGLGKRDTMAEALKIIVSQRPSKDSHVILMDGDTLLGHGSLQRTCAVLSALPHVGAVTVDHAPLVKGSAFTREWYRLRFAQRHVLMSSMALSGKILVLTGRFSVFKAELATSPSFIEAVENDFILHGRLGRIPLLTGDDKSTWFDALRKGWDLLYVPDVVIFPVEELPAGGFFRASASLMRRWYGNMIRNNWRALQLGPSRLGLFAWICLLDQRVSMWTSLMGPGFALVALVAGYYRIFFGYMLWILVSRGIVCAVYKLSSGRFHPLFLIILYYNQVMDALMKIYALFHPDRQKWTRQQIAGDDASRRTFASTLSTPYMVVTVAVFMLALVDFANIFHLHQMKRKLTGLSHVFMADTRPAPFVRTPVR